MRTLVFVALGAIFALSFACGGDDDDGGPTDAITPAGTKADTPTPPPDGGGNGAQAPNPPVPQLDEELTEIASGTFEATIEPGGNYPVDTIVTAAEASGDPSVSCETSPNFAFGFAWQVQDPYPADGVQLVWQISRDDGNVEIGNTPASEQTVGCVTLVALNNGDAPLTMAVNWRAGVLQ